jgi:hypothetical protein
MEKTKFVSDGKRTHDMTFGVAFVWISTISSVLRN